MSKNKDQKRKAQVSAKAKAESFKFQVEYARQQRASFIAENAPELMAEMEVICQNGLVDAMLALHNIVDAGRIEFGVEPEGEGCSLNGALVPYILGFTPVCPDSADTYVPGVFTGPFPMAVTLVYDNEVRNKVVDWAKAHYDGMTTRFGQPFLKLPNMIVEFKRMIKKEDEA